ncbi:hypothetical protein Ancab_010749 [Ancistrocladus abbreviatus]
MAFSQGAKYPFGIIYRRLGHPIYSGHGYSTLTSKSIPVPKDEVGQISSLLTKYAHSIAAPRTSLRICTAVASAAEPTSLIKQLRERTSAPMKDVNSALVDCNWDIEPAQKKLRRRGVVLASKKSSQTAAEGLLALAQNESKLALLVEDSSQQVSGAFPVAFEHLEVSFIEARVPSSRKLLLSIVFLMCKIEEGLCNVESFTWCSFYVPAYKSSARCLTLLPNSEQTVGSELAMHVAAAKPLFLTKELVSPDALESEHEILKSQSLFA